MFEPTETLPGAIQGWAEREPDRPFLRDVHGNARSVRPVPRGGLALGGRVPSRRDCAGRQRADDGEDDDLGRGALAGSRLVAGRPDGHQHRLPGPDARVRPDGLPGGTNDLRAGVPGPRGRDRRGVERLELVIVPDARPEELPPDFPVPLVSRHRALGCRTAGDRSLHPPATRDRLHQLHVGHDRAVKRGARALGALVAERVLDRHVRRRRLLLPLPGVPSFRACSPSPGWASRAGRWCSGTHSRPSASGTTSAPTAARSRR